MREGSVVVVVTGASSGVGRACAREFARHGARLALLARGVDGLEAAQREVAECGGQALVLPLDVANADAVEAAAAAIEEESGPIDVWGQQRHAVRLLSCRRAGRRGGPPRHRSHLLGTVHGTLAALRRMGPRDRGVIVQVGSALAYRAIPLQAAYCAAKHAIEGFGESLRCELSHDGSNVRVTMVQLPALNTPHFSVVTTRLPRHPKPVPPIFEPEVAAHAVVWAAEHPRRELWVGGSTVKALLANKLAPGLLDRYLARTGYTTQQTDVPVEPGRPDNLFDALPGDRGAHGSSTLKRGRAVCSSSPAATGGPWLPSPSRLRRSCGEAAATDSWRPNFDSDGRRSPTAGTGRNDARLPQAATPRHRARARLARRARGPHGRRPAPRPGAGADARYGARLDLSGSGGALPRRRAWRPRRPVRPSRPGRRRI